MRTAIFTSDRTTLTIETTETINLEQIGVNEVRTLPPGTHQIPVGSSVFRILSRRPVTVTAPIAIDVQVSPNEKDPPSDPKIVTPPIDAKALEEFFTSKAQLAPE